MNPLQQGLKPSTLDDAIKEAEVAIMNPLQQGLKRGDLSQYPPPL